MAVWYPMHIYKIVALVGMDLFTIYNIILVTRNKERKNAPQQRPSWNKARAAAARISTRHS